MRNLAGLLAGAALFAVAVLLPRRTEPPPTPTLPPVAAPAPAPSPVSVLPSSPALPDLTPAVPETSETIEEEVSRELIRPYADEVARLHAAGYSGQDLLTQLAMTDQRRSLRRDRLEALLIRRLGSRAAMLDYVGEIRSRVAASGRWPLPGAQPPGWEWLIFDLLGRDP